MKIWWAHSSQPQEGDRTLTPSEVLGFCFLLLIAGNETTTKLHRQRDSSGSLRSRSSGRSCSKDPSLIPAAVEETLRYDTSTQALARVVTRDVELHGVTIPEGRKGLLLFGSANRDERRWDEPDRFDIDRNPAGHLAFGHGLHHCLGAPLARLESRVALEVLLPLVGEYEVDASDAERVHSGNVRGFSRLPIELAVMTKKHHVRIGKDPERLNRRFWDEDADDYQAEHELAARRRGHGLGRVGPPGVRPRSARRRLRARRARVRLRCARSSAIKVARAGARVTGLDQSRGQLQPRCREGRRRGCRGAARLRERDRGTDARRLRSTSSSATTAR